MTGGAAVHLAVTLPFAAGVLALLIPRRAAALTKVIAALVSAVVFAAALSLYGSGFTWASIGPEQTYAWAGGVSLAGFVVAWRWVRMEET